MKPRVRRIPRIALIAVAAIVTALALAGTYGAYRTDLRAARARVASGSEIANTRCGPIEYRSAGEGPALLLVHGAGGGFDQAADYAAALAATGLRVITMSRFGYLRTPLPPDASAEAQADAHACLLDALGIRRSAILGVSAGAPSSVQFALRHPQRCTALILLVPGIYTPDSERTAVTTTWGMAIVFATFLRSDFLYWTGTKALPRMLIRTVLATPTDVFDRVEEDEQKRAIALLENILPISERRQGLTNDGAIISSLPRYRLERIKTPALIMSVADDRFGTFAGAQYTAAQIPGARFVGFQTGGHVWLGRHQAMMEEVVAFLKEHSSVRMDTPPTTVTCRRARTAG